MHPEYSPSQYIQYDGIRRRQCGFLAGQEKSERILSKQIPPVRIISILIYNTSFIGLSFIPEEIGRAHV